MNYYAHTRKDANGAPVPDSEWELLYTGPCPQDCLDCECFSPSHGHLNKVATWTARFAAEMFPPNSKESQVAHDWGFVTGLWHDVGKYSTEFQELLRGKRERVDHSTAGAQCIDERFQNSGVGQLLAYLIAGHHAGLADWNRNGSESDLSSRLKNQRIPSWKHHAPRDLLEVTDLELPPCDRKQSPLFARLLFSCLVDADYLATEAFMNGEQSERRFDWPEDLIVRMRNALDVRLQEFGAPSSSVDAERNSIREACVKSAEKEQGLFTLTVPTGGGKTLSSLAFALKHAIRHRLRRIIYVIPFTSIIEQNAKEFRETFAALTTEIGQDVVLEHHSSFEGGAESAGDQKSVWKLAAENWDAPLIVTTNVQFFESLYACKTSRCRKLHNIARSVVILDEAQNLPVDFLHPCLEMLKHLTEFAGCSAVLCTATQPAVGKREGEFPIGLDLGVDREIIPDPQALYQRMRRVTVLWEPEPVSDDDLIHRLMAHARVLCILNTRKHASRVFQQLGDDDPANLHLSAQMCPEHRESVLEEVRWREQTKASCRLIATTVVEAGVDIDFPAVYRAITGLDSFAQAAGRCNRHGRFVKGESCAVLFEPQDEKIPGFLIQNVNASKNVLPDHEDVLDLKAIECFFRQYYFLQGKPFKWDRKKILDYFTVRKVRPAFLFNFKSAAKEFQLIPNSQEPVIIEPKEKAWERMDRAKCESICQLISAIRDSHRGGYPPPKGSDRRLQRYAVQVPRSIWHDAIRQGAVEVFHERFAILTHPENHYDAKLGLQMGANNVSAFMI